MSKCARYLYLSYYESSICFTKKPNKEVRELITNPFLLNITLQALPDLNSEQASGNLVISRANLYEGFIKYWYTKEIAGKGKSILECSQFVCHKFAQ